MAKNNALGKGLGVLFEENDFEESSGLLTLRVASIEPNKNQPRKKFNDDEIEELADSIKTHGLLQPVVVRTLQPDVYQIIAGERRWRAAKVAGLEEVPAIIIEADDAKVLELAMIENLQRKDLTPIEEAQGYKELMEAAKLTQEQVAKRLGKSRPVIANAVRLLTLPQEALDAINDGVISAGHGRALVAHIDNPDLFKELLDAVLNDNLSVHQLEDLASVLSKKTGQTEIGVPVEETTWGQSFYKEVELSLRDILNSRVTVRKKGKTGTLEIQFTNEDELKSLAKKLGHDEQ